jgi:hypothetical protein
MKNYLILSFALFFIFSCGKDEPTPTTNTNTGTSTIQTLNCDSISYSSTFTKGTLATNVSATLPYKGANGGTFSAISIASTGVTGLTASATAGTLANGNGKLTLKINGTPSSNGTANFSINLGGKTCTFSAIILNKLDTPNLVGNYTIYEIVDASYNNGFDTIIKSQINGTVTKKNANPLIYNLKQATRTPIPDWVAAFGQNMGDWDTDIKYSKDTFRIPDLAFFHGGVIYNKDSFKLTYSFGGYDGGYYVTQTWKRK